MLEKMILGIQERWLTNNIYVSPSCAANEPILSRDINDNHLIK